MFGKGPFFYHFVISFESQNQEKRKQKLHISVMQENSEKVSHLQTAILVILEIYPW